MLYRAHAQPWPLYRLFSPRDIPGSRYDKPRDMMIIIRLRRWAGFSRRRADGRRALADETCQRGAQLLPPYVETPFTMRAPPRRVLRRNAFSAIRALQSFSPSRLPACRHAWYFISRAACRQLSYRPPRLYAGQCQYTRAAYAFSMPAAGRRECDWLASPAFQHFSRAATLGLDFSPR